MSTLTGNKEAVGGVERELEVDKISENSGTLPASNTKVKSSH